MREVKTLVCVCVHHLFIDRCLWGPEGPRQRQSPGLQSPKSYPNQLPPTQPQDPLSQRGFPFSFPPVPPSKRWWDEDIRTKRRELGQPSEGERGG